jgi:DNA-binding response OmpR family regulator
MAQTLLIADGDAELSELYRQFFTAHGYKVEISSDGLDCLEKLRCLDPAVLVLDPDLHWGGFDGVLAWLLDESRVPGIPVILTGEVGNPRYFIKYIGLSDVENLPKPFALSVLLEKVRSAVAKQARRMPLILNRASPEFFIG